MEGPFSVIFFHVPPAVTELKVETVNEQKSKALRASQFSPSFSVFSRLSNQTVAASPTKRTAARPRRAGALLMQLYLRRSPHA